MKLVVISVSRPEVIAEVALNSAYRAIRSQSPAHRPELQAMSSADRRLADWLFDDAVAKVLTALRPLTAAVANSLDVFQLSLTLDDTWPTDLEAGATNHLKGCIVNHILAGWLDMAGCAEAGKTAASSADELSQLQAILYHRAAPKRII